MAMNFSSGVCKLSKSSASKPIFNMAKMYMPKGGPREEEHSQDKFMLNTNNFLRSRLVCYSTVHVVSYPDQNI